MSPRSVVRQGTGVIGALLVLLTVARPRRLWRGRGRRDEALGAREERAGHRRGRRADAPGEPARRRRRDRERRRRRELPAQRRDRRRQRLPPGGGRLRLPELRRRRRPTTSRRPRWSRCSATRSAWRHGDDCQLIPPVGSGWTIRTRRWAAATAWASRSRRSGSSRRRHTGGFRGASTRELDIEEKVDSRSHRRDCVYQGCPRSRRSPPRHAEADPRHPRRDPQPVRRTTPSASGRRDRRPRHHAVRGRGQGQGQGRDPGLRQQLSGRPAADDVQRGKNTWRYVGGTNPQNLGDVYRGTRRPEHGSDHDARRGAAALPVLPGRGRQRRRGTRSTVLPAKQVSEMTLTGDVENHPHLMLTTTRTARPGSSRASSSGRSRASRSTSPSAPQGRPDRSRGILSRRATTSASRSTARS